MSNGRRGFLNFHGIGSCERPLEAGEEPVWISAQAFRSIVDHFSDKADFCFTFDDGNKSDVEIALPILLQRRARAKFFVLAGRVGSPGFLDSTDLRTLIDAGMEIGLHGFDHVSWRVANDHVLRREGYRRPGYPAGPEEPSARKARCRNSLTVESASTRACSKTHFDHTRLRRAHTRSSIWMPISTVRRSWFCEACVTYSNPAHISISTSLHRMVTRSGHFASSSTTRDCDSSFGARHATYGTSCSSASRSE